MGTGAEVEAWDLGLWRVVTASSGSSETGQREHRAAGAKALTHCDTERRARREAGSGRKGRARARDGARCPAPPPRPAQRPLPLQPPHRSQEAEQEEEARGPGGSRRASARLPHGAQRALLDHRTSSTARARRGWGRGGPGPRGVAALARVTLGRPRDRTPPPRLPTSDPGRGRRGNPRVRDANSHGRYRVSS